MLGFLNGIRRAKKTAPSQSRKKTIIKKAFSLLPPVMAVKLVKQVIAKNKNKPRAASQNTQMRALKNAIAQKKAQTFIKKNKSLMLDDADLNETPVSEQNIIDDQIEQEVENEIETEEVFEDEQADLGVFYPISLSGKAERKARQEAKLDKKKAKTEKIRAKAQLKIDKGQAKKDRALRPRANLKDITSTVLDTVKSGVSIYKDIKGGGSGEGGPEGSTIRTVETEPSFFEKNKTMLIVGGAGLLVAGFLLMKKKGKQNK
jgi:hypothetical protein